MNILAIGNSFSQDGTRYLHQIAKSAGAHVTVVNLCIGGCSFERHFRNIQNDAKAYAMEFNGVWTGFEMSIKEALLSRAWDVVTIQQVSNQSPRYETYQPYMNVLVNYIKEYCPKAKLYIQQVWSYENGSGMLAGTPYATSKEMFACTKASYDKALEESGAAGLIRSGELMLYLHDELGLRVHRDGFHASLGFARYALGLMWYATLTGRNVDDVTLKEFDEEVTDEEIATAKAAVKKILGV